MEQQPVVGDGSNTPRPNCHDPLRDCDWIEREEEGDPYLECAACGIQAEVFQ